MIKKISYERRVYESGDDNSLSKAISQKNDEKNKSCNKGLNILKNISFRLGLLGCTGSKDQSLNGVWLSKFIMVLISYMFNRNQL